MKHGRYIGSAPGLYGKTALLRDDVSPGLVLAQFDSLQLAALCFGWHRFNATDFKMPA